MARTAALRADVAFAVGLPGMKGLHSLVRVLNELRGIGVAPSRIVPVLNRAPKSGRARAEMTATLSALTAAGGSSFGPPMFLPERRVDEQLRDGVRLPGSLSEPPADAFASTLAHAGLPVAPGPEPVRPGSLGSWAAEGDPEEAALG